ncbi:MAG: hypothetical protein FWG87_05660 [Defluviitaleaceae bacterium]|nr:hypothetical protein [Defluviitaleaceae bacterium]
MSWVFVGDGFIRPEVTSPCVNARYPSRIDERAYLGTDKSVPYNKDVIRFTYVHCLSKRFSHRGTEAQRERGIARISMKIKIRSYF